MARLVGLMRIILGMIAVISDIHGNLAALNAVVADAKSRGCSRFISLGDVVGYYCQPNECINVLMQCNAINILGNHDSYILNDEPCSRSKLISQIIEHHKSLVGGAELKWLQRSKLALRIGSTLFVHGGPADTQDQYLYQISGEIFPKGINLLASGHTHVQVKAKFGKKMYFNPGSVGQPRDGDPRAAYATLNKDQVKLHRLEYDIDETALAMQKAGYESSYYENLYRGEQIGGKTYSVKILREEC